MVDVMFVLDFRRELQLMIAVPKRKRARKTFDRNMAQFHMTEAELARDLHGVLGAGAAGRRSVCGRRRSADGSDPAA
jgi:hypothetical protein